MYQVKLQFFGGDPHVPKPCQIGAGVFAHAYWSIAANCHETAPIPAADYEAHYRQIPDKWRIVVLAETPALETILATLANEPHEFTPPAGTPFDATPEPAAPAQAPVEPAKAGFRELRAIAKERGIPVPIGTTTEELRALVEAPAPVTA